MAKQTSAQADRHRVRALQGSWLKDLTDSQREYIWRSILKGTRKKQVLAVYPLSEDQYEQAVARVRKRYEARIAAYKRLPKIVRPVVMPARPVSVKRRGWFGW